MGSYRVYKLPSSVSAELYVLIPMTAGGLVYLAFLVSQSPPIFDLLFAATIFLAVASALCYALTRIVREIIVHLDGTLEFRAAYRTSVLLPAQIHSFKIKNEGALRTAVVEHDRGRLRLYSLTPEILNDVVGYVTRSNPSVQVVETKSG